MPTGLWYAWPPIKTLLPLSLGGLKITRISTNASLPVLVSSTMSMTLKGSVDVTASVVLSAATLEIPLVVSSVLLISAMLLPSAVVATDAIVSPEENNEEENMD